MAVGAMEVATIMVARGRGGGCVGGSRGGGDGGCSGRSLF